MSDERVHAGHDARDEAQLVGAGCQKDLPVAPCLRGGRIDRHVRGDVGPEHRVQFVDGLLQVGFDLIGQRLGVVARGLPCAAGKVGDADAAFLEEAGPVHMPTDDADAADGGRGRGIDAPGGRREVIGGGGAQAVGVGVHGLRSLRGQPRGQLRDAGGHAARRVEAEQQRGGGPVLHGQRDGGLDGVVADGVPFGIAVTVDGAGNIDDRHAFPHGVEEGAAAMRGGGGGPGRGCGVLAVGGGKHGVEGRQGVGRDGPEALSHQLGKKGMGFMHVTAPFPWRGLRTASFRACAASRRCPDRARVRRGLPGGS